MALNLFDRVRLVENKPEWGIPKGTRGTVVHVHKRPSTAYEVEFFGSIGETIGVWTVEPEEIRPIVDSDS